VSFPDPGEAYCGSPDRSIAERPTSTAGRHQRALRDRRDARVAQSNINIVQSGETLEVRVGPATKGHTSPRC
jgi:hypothetical protein